MTTAHNNIFSNPYKILFFFSLDILSTLSFWLNWNNSLLFQLKYRIGIKCCEIPLAQNAANLVNSQRHKMLLIC